MARKPLSLSDGPESPFVHLCQPDASKSCGACCGLYNYADSSREDLAERLRNRTRLFRQTVRSPEDLSRFSEKVNGMEDGRKRYAVIHCCEYVGFLDGQEKRVGCLLHPLQNAGRDMRDASFYGRELCDGHFCPSYSYLSRAEKLAILEILDDWYLYGVCITDIDLVKEFFRHVSEAAGEMPAPRCFSHPVLREAARRFFDLKLAWPFRSDAANRFGKYSFDGTDYFIDSIDYAALGCEKSRFDRVFLSLQSTFKNRRDVQKAEELIRQHLRDVVDRYKELVDYH
ncbi:MAG TPA: hypothetical protein VFG28_06215 [Syntrophales bacterium]|nr:hypothetical protein [Syntrophales bacterium]